MGRKQKEESDLRRSSSALGRDELNLAEFPLASLSARLPAGQKTLVFTDRTWDRGKNQSVNRRLTITGSDAYGLPTALDDEVIVGLIQLSRQQDFASKEVFFSRYRLIRLLGWRDEGKSYTRLETSLKRWLGVTLYYEKAWWDKRESAWVDENFHILERLSLYDRERRLRRLGMNEPALSSFAWNPVVFRSFQAGNLKGLDMGLFRRLRTPVAKRLYRLLDKRFYHKNRWQFDLRELACEHVGLSRSYDNGQLKRKLRTAIGELEEQGYLVSVPWPERFHSIRRGKWTIEFIRKPPPKRSKSRIDVQAVVSQDTSQAPKRRRAGRSGSGGCRGHKRREISTEAEIRRQINEYWQSLSPTEQIRLRDEAMAQAAPMLLESLGRAEADPTGVLKRIYEQMILDQYLAEFLPEFKPGRSNGADS